MHKIQWKIERRGIDTIKPYGKNPRIIKGKKLEDLKKSIEKFGLAEPIVINTDGTIIGGHARYYVLLDEKVEAVDCYVPDKKFTEAQVAELCIRLNKNIAGEWDFGILGNSFDISDLKDWGFEDWEFTDFELDTSKNKNKEVSTDDLKGTFTLSFTFGSSQEYMDVMDNINKIRIDQKFETKEELLQFFISQYA